ncbi:alpha/beta hydrolase, partial [Mycobacterium kiyosense]
MLEMIEKGSPDAQPLLFVHGGWHGAWCWENFLNYFADAGYRAVAMSLRGHGASATAKPLNRCSMADYIDDVGTAVDILGGQPVLIGHSLGGFTVQRYLETHRAPGAVLVGSVPPKGYLRLATRVWRKHPLIAIRGFTGGTLLEFVDTPQLARDYLFCAQTPAAIVESCRSQAGPESLRAAAVDPMIRGVKTKLITTPML